MTAAGLIPAMSMRLLDINVCLITSSQDIKRSNMQALFLRIIGFGRKHGFKLIILILVIFSINMLYESGKVGFFDAVVKENPKGNNNRSAANSSITLFVRMSGKLEKHRTRFYCDHFRTTLLFWPASLGKTVVVLDEESEQDHIFGNNITGQIEQHFPRRKLEVSYESLPKDESILNFTASSQPPGYNRQLWSSFFIDLYTDDPIIAWMDSDATFLTPVTKATIFNGSKIRILGSECSMHLQRVRGWANTTEIALGLPMVANFMSYFPVYIYRDTFTHCREYILKRFNTSNFEEAFKKSYNGPDVISPVNVVISYAWFFERDRYDWNLKICSDLNSYNTRFPVDHKIKPQHTEDILSQPQTALHMYHTARIKTEYFLYNIFASYCLSQRAADKQQAICSTRSFSVDTNLILFNHDLMKLRRGHETPCIGSKRNHCLKILERHYIQIGTEIKQGREIEWGDLGIVEKLAKEAGFFCTYSLWAIKCESWINTVELIWNVNPRSQRL